MTVMLMTHNLEGACLAKEILLISFISYTAHQRKNTLQTKNSRLIILLFLERVETLVWSIEFIVLSGFAVLRTIY